MGLYHQYFAGILSVLLRILGARNTSSAVGIPSVPGGVTSIYTGTGCAIFWGAFFQVENKFWGIIFGKIIHGHKFWGIIFSMTLNFGVSFQE